MVVGGAPGLFFIYPEPFIETERMDVPLVTYQKFSLFFYIEFFLTNINYISTFTYLKMYLKGKLKLEFGKGKTKSKDGRINHGIG